MRVLVVMNDPRDRELFKRRIEADFPDTVAIEPTHKDNALQKLDLIKYSVVIAGWLEAMSGTPCLVKQIRKTRPDIPFLISTGGRGESEQKDAKSKGVTEIVLRPHFDQLIRRLRHYLDRELRR